MRRGLLLIFVAMLVVLTVLLKQAEMPDQHRHAEVLDALRGIDLAHAALQRDVLRARVGILADYDALADSSGILRDHAALLRVAAADPQLGSAGLSALAAGFAAAVEEQDELLERFKTQNALLQNSGLVFERLSRDLMPGNDAASGPSAVEALRLVAAIIRLARDPTGEAFVDALVARRRIEAIEPSRGFGTLAAHARIISEALPVVETSLLALQTAPVAQRAEGFREAYGRAYDTLAARAGLFRLALYGAAIALAGYVAFLFLRLDHHARLHRQRAALEAMLGSAAAELLDLPHGKLPAGLDLVMARLGRHAGIDRVRVALARDEGLGNARVWHRERGGISVEEDADLLAAYHQCRGTAAAEFVLGDVARLEAGPIREGLRERGTRAWLAVPIRGKDGPDGLLALEGRQPRRWSEGDRTMLRMAAGVIGSALARDAAEREREALRTRLLRAERLEALGTLATGIAHEFNNILGTMTGHAELALDGLRPGVPARRHVSQVLTGGRRAKVVIDDILAYSRAPARRRQSMRPQPAVEEALDLLAASLPAGIVMRRNLAAPQARILGDLAGVQQVVMNLCTNAAQAMQAEGVLEVGCDTASPEEPLILSHGQLPPGGYFRLRVADTGAGIAPAHLSHIFEPFFTTKTLGQGTGLGLALVHGIVAHHGGAIDVRSRIGDGTAFMVHLPLTDRPLPATGGEDAQVPRGAGQTVLLVDADPDRLPLTEEMVAALGYEAIGVADGAVARDRLRAAPGSFDLLLVVDATDGEAAMLFAAARDVCPGMPVLAVADPARTAALLQQELAPCEVIGRPLRLGSLADALGRHLMPAAAG